MTMRPITLACGLLLACLSAAASVCAAQDGQVQTRGVYQQVQSEQGLNLPARGLSMAQVQHLYGSPKAQLAPRGGSNRQQPVIHRWVYPGYIVYFERNRVIHSVATVNAASS